METKSTHKVEVVPVVLEKHPNADSLSIIRVFGYTVCGRTSDWEGVTQAAWIPPDSLVPVNRPEFSFLWGPDTTKYYSDGVKVKQELRKAPPTHALIRAKKLRGVLSYGLLVPAPEGSVLGEDVADKLNILHWQPPEPTVGLKAGGEAAPAPAVYSPKYDVDSFQRYASEVFKQGEPVWVTEKIHGCNGRWVYASADNEFHCGSRTEWKREYTLPPKDFVDVELQKVQPRNLWWKVLDTTPLLKEWLKAHPDMVVYGEVYGQVQDLKYGCKPGEVRLAIFDIMDRDGQWLNAGIGPDTFPELPWVPLVAETVYDFDKLVELAEGPSFVPGADNIREGVVVKPLLERTHPTIGRVNLKVVSPAYLTRRD